MMYRSEVWSQVRIVGRVSSYQQLLFIWSWGNWNWKWNFMDCVQRSCLWFRSTTTFWLCVFSSQINLTINHICCVFSSQIFLVVCQLRHCSTQAMSMKISLASIFAQVPDTRNCWNVILIFFNLIYRFFVLTKFHRLHTYNTNSHY